jgi:phospholipase C
MVCAAIREHIAQSVGRHHGYALVDRTPDNVMQVLRNFLLFDKNKDDNLYDWLGNRSIDWRIYHSGTPFFLYEPSVLAKYRADRNNQFRSIFDLRQNVLDHDVASVIFLEPMYQDDPHRGSTRATDDHPPASLAGGQAFLKMVFDGLTATPEVWESLMLIITYDEHGSFFDHIPPRPIPFAAPQNAHYKGFDTTGLRVPGIVVSPFVEPGSVCETLFDHTSILKLLAEKFGDGRYSDILDARPVKSLSEVLSDQRLDASFHPLAPPQPPWA